MKKLLKIAICSVLFVLPLSTFAQVEERVVQYDSNIEVMADSSMVVTETIQVISAADQIQHGIYRDFPIAYKDSRGQRYFVSFDVLEIKRDGESEPYHIERSGNGLRVYIGDADVLVPVGPHTYSIKYKTDRHLGFFEDHDELYWNVTGNGWSFPIDSATATVKLPNGVDKENISAILYTGTQGSTAQNGTSDTGASVVRFASTQPLEPNEGLTIVVGWPKGVVTPPTASQNFWAEVKANLDYIVGFLGLLVILVYYFYFWNKRGRDPKKGTIIAQYEPPQGFSPAFLRFVRRMGNDSKSLAAAIINLGVKGELSIKENKGFLKKTTYTLTKISGSSTQAKLSEDEVVLKDKLFSSEGTITLEKSNAVAISAMRESFYEALTAQAGSKYFAKNISIAIFGIALSIMAFTGAIAAAASVRYDVTSFLPFVFWPFLVISLIVINIVFGLLIRAYTLEGRKLVDEIEGFKLFLSVTEKDRLAFHNPPEQTSQLFEKMLPYALALDVEHEWAKQFASVFAGLKDQGVNYIPAWYLGSSISNFNANSFASEIGSTFSGVVSSASTPPGSSSGSSGGFSGGGGGGGGGGGW